MFLKMFVFTTITALLHHAQNVHCSTYRLPLQSEDLSHLTIIVKASRYDGSAMASLMKTVRIPRITSVRDQITKFRVPFEITVNRSIVEGLFIDGKINQHKTLKWKDLHILQPFSQLIRIYVPVNLTIPAKVKSVVENSSGDTHDAGTAVQPNVGQSKREKNSMSFAGLPDAFYRSEVAVGDPVRSRRVKRKFNGSSLDSSQ